MNLKYNASIKIEPLITETKVPAMKMSHWVESKSAIMSPRLPDFFRVASWCGFFANCR